MSVKDIQKHEFHIFIILLIVCVEQIHGDCSMMISGIHRCYDMIDMKIPQTNLESFLSVPLDYMKSCGTIKQEEFLTCYSGLLDLCTEYQLVNPLMMDVLSIKSLMYGACANREAYLRGLECGTNRSVTFHGFLRNCFNNRYLALATESVETGNWTNFCLNVDANHRCLQVIIKAFGCEEGFSNVVREFVYSVQPHQCRDARDNAFRWLFVYGGWNRSIFSSDPGITIYDGLSMAIFSTGGHFHRRCQSPGLFHVSQWNQEMLYNDWYPDPTTGQREYLTTGYGLYAVLRVYDNNKHMDPAQEEFLSCYANVLKYCDKYQSVNPLMFDVITARSVIYGLCDNREVLTKGMECAMQKSALFHTYLSQCYNNKYFAKAMDAIASRNWSSFCMDTHAEFTCMEMILRHFDCGEKFLEAVRHYAYAIQPWQCRDATDNYHWIRTYGAVSNGGGVAKACRMDKALMFSVGATSARFIIDIALHVLLVLMEKFLNQQRNKTEK